MLAERREGKGLCKCPKGRRKERDCVGQVREGNDVGVRREGERGEKGQCKG